MHGVERIGYSCRSIIAGWKQKSRKTTDAIGPINNGQYYPLQIVKAYNVRTANSDWHNGIG